MHTVQEAAPVTQPAPQSHLPYFRALSTVPATRLRFELTEEAGYIYLTPGSKPIQCQKEEFVGKFMDAYSPLTLDWYRV